jgi:alpha-galactosidase
MVCLALAWGVYGLMSTPADAAKGPVKVFILAGQSNMQGKAAASTLEPVIADPTTAEDFRHLKKDGEWTVRDDVWVTFLCKTVKAPADDLPLYGPLTVGFGSQKTARDENNERISVPGIGPELGFGHVVGEHFEEQVLLIKTAWGGKSVRVNFRPPSATPSDEELRLELERRKKKNPDVTLEEVRESYGAFYREMLAQVREPLENMGKYFPEYDAGQGFEIAGMVWFQGWNDGVGRGNPQYTEQLAHLIRDVRRDLGVPNMPVVIGELGVDGDEPMGWIATFRKQQAAVAEMPEFKDNVRFARTAQCWPSWQGSLDGKWGEFKAKEKAWREQLKAEGKTPTREEVQAFGDEHWREPNQATLARMSDKRYHYMGCGETQYRMGEAFGAAMLEMVR